MDYLIAKCCASLNRRGVSEIEFRSSPSFSAASKNAFTSWEGSAIKFSFSQVASSIGYLKEKCFVSFQDAHREAYPSHSTKYSLRCPPFFVLIPMIRFTKYSPSWVALLNGQSGLQQVPAGLWHDSSNINKCQQYYKLTNPTLFSVNTAR